MSLRTSTVLKKRVPS